MADETHPLEPQDRPDLDHSTCRKAMNTRTGEWECIGYHCPVCGAPCDELGHHCLTDQGDHCG